MAPEKAPYYFGTKRNPLENDYYEVLNQSNVTIHDLNAVPLKSFHEKGLVMADDKLHEFDAVVLATGFDSYTGSLTNMGMIFHWLRVGLRHADLLQRLEEQGWRRACRFVERWHLDISRNHDLWVP